MSADVVEDIRAELENLETLARRFHQGEITPGEARYRVNIYYRPMMPTHQNLLRVADITPEERKEAQSLLANYKVSMDSLERAANQREANQRGSRRKTLRRKRKNGKKRTNKRRY